MTNIDALRYPIGKFLKQETYSIVEINKNLQQFAELPNQIKSLLTGIESSQLENTYRENGWNVNQLVNHLLDSHINSYVRFKLAATEDTPIVRPYNESQWAKTSDYNLISPIEALITLGHIHNRISALVHDWTIDQWNKAFYHPGRKELLTLAQNIALYSWHSRHHLSHIKIALSKDL